LILDLSQQFERLVMIARGVQLILKFLPDRRRPAFVKPG
jgi:hypothetical protein